MIVPASPPRILPHPAPGTPLLRPVQAQPLAPRVLRFGEIASPDTKIDDDIYDFIRSAPKNELHLHQSGSSDIAFLKYALLRDVMDKKLTRLTRINLKTHRQEEVDLAALSPEDLSKTLEALLEWEHLREYFRFNLQIEQGTAFLPSQRLSERQGTGPTSTTVEVSQYFEQLRQAGLETYRGTSARINPMVKNLPAAYLLAHLYALDVANENIRYAEYRVSPVGNNFASYQNCSTGQLMHAVSDGFRDARNRLEPSRRKFDYGILMLMERQGDGKVAKATQVARDAIALSDRYNIVGIDLAGDELNNPVQDFAEAFQIIRQHNAACDPLQRKGITIHAGETARSGELQGWESMEKAIDLAWDEHTPVRIGHGIQLVNSSGALKDAFEAYLRDPDGWEKTFPKDKLLAASPLLQKIIDRGIVLEMCPKSNLQTYAVHPGLISGNEDGEDKYSARSYRRHPAVFLSRLGVKVAISTDNRTISHSDVTNEFVKLFKYGGMTYADFKRMVINGFEGAFVFDPQKKKAMLDEVEARFNTMERDPGYLLAIKKMGKVLSWGQRYRILRMNVGQWLAKQVDALKARLKHFKLARAGV